MKHALAPERIWLGAGLLRGEGQGAARAPSSLSRHRYNLEPNVKSSPGGLARHPDHRLGGEAAFRHRHARRPRRARLPDPQRAAQAARPRQAFLWRVRFALHMLTGRREDRLLFDHQIKLAKLFGYEDATYTLAVEQFMQRYYRTVMDVSLLNEMLLQLFREAILTPNRGEPVPLNARFQIRNDYLRGHAAMTCSRATRRRCWKLFVLLQQQPADSWRARRDDPPDRPQPVADRRGIPPEPAPSPAVPGDPARPGRRDARAAAHEPVRRARPLHSRRSAASSGACSTTCSMPIRSTRTRCSW